MGIFTGCGGGSGSGAGSGSEFQIVSGNWFMGLPGNSSAAGSLIQTGNSISGVLHVAGSPCFDPNADELIVTGKSSNDGSNSITFTTAPIRGQVLTVVGKYAALLANHFGPPAGPVGLLDTAATISGGACAGQQNAAAQNLAMNGAWGTLPDPGFPGANANLTQSAPDASGVSHLSGTFNFSNTSCFTTGTISSGSVLGDTVQITINTDSGQLVASGNFLFIFPGSPSELIALRVALDANLQGGTCNGQTFKFLLLPS